MLDSTQLVGGLFLCIGGHRRGHCRSLASFRRHALVCAGDTMTAAAIPFIEWRGLRHGYGSGNDRVEALQQIDAQVHSSEFVSLLGPSGCGKTTLLLLSGGLMRPTAGQVLVNGEPLGGPYVDMSIVFQRDLLFEWRSSLGNVLLPA